MRRSRAFIVHLKLNDRELNSKAYSVSFSEWRKTDQFSEQFPNSHFASKIKTASTSIPGVKNRVFGCVCITGVKENWRR